MIIIQKKNRMMIKTWTRIMKKGVKKYKEVIKEMGVSNRSEYIH